MTYEHDVSDGLHGYNHTLNDVLETLCPVDGPKWTKHPKDSQNLHDGYGVWNYRMDFFHFDVRNSNQIWGRMKLARQLPPGYPEDWKHSGRTNPKMREKEFVERILFYAQLTLWRTNP